MTSEPPPIESIHESDRQARLARQEAAAPKLEKWAQRNWFFYDEIRRLICLHVPPNARVLEVGCGLGDQLAALGPHDGLGIDLSPKVIDIARHRHPTLRFEVMDPENFELDEKFDYVVIGHSLADMDDIQSCLECVRKVCRPETRVILSYYSALWGPLLRLASLFRLRRRTGEQNWLGPEDFANLLRLTGFESISRTVETLLPKRVPYVSAFFNRYVAKFWPFKHLCLNQMIVARPLAPPTAAAGYTCTVVIPTRNERGNIAAAIERMPEIGRHTQIIFVDGNSTDGTVQEIERVIGVHPEKAISLIHQGAGRGKGDAVRQGFAAAKGDVLIILDADLTVPPEDLPRFFEPIVTGQGEFINGTRLVYPVERMAMRFLNKAGNRFFSLLLSWLLGQPLRDTLCGTKALTKRNYEMIAFNRGYFGELDPFGDFDLIFGAARADLKIIEVPVRYRARRYGVTSIHRFRHGWMLLKMSWVAFKALKLR